MTIRRFLVAVGSCLSSLCLIAGTGCCKGAVNDRRVTQPTPTTSPATVTTSPFDQWEMEIAAFEASDHIAAPPKNAILFIGSSTIRLWSSLAQDFPNHNVINRGFGGSEIQDSIHFADRIILPYQPRMIVLNAGTNDIANGKSAQQVFEDFKLFVATVRQTLPNTRIAYLAIQPAPSRWDQSATQWNANKLIEAYTRLGDNLDYIEVWHQYLSEDGTPDPKYYVADRLHGNDAGYRIRADVVRRHLPAADRNTR